MIRGHRTRLRLLVCCFAWLACERPINAGDHQFVQADAHQFRGLKLSAVATPNAAENTASITISISISNRTAREVRFLAEDVFLSNIEVNVKSDRGEVVTAVRPLQHREPVSVRTFYLSEGESIGDSATLHDLGYDLEPGHYTVLVSVMGVSSNVRSLYADPVAVTLDR